MFKCIKIVCVCAALVAVCATAFQLVRSSWGGVVYFYPEGGMGYAAGEGIDAHRGRGRALASVDKRYDFSNLGQSSGLMASKKRLVESLKWHREGKLLGVELGHFVIKTGASTKNFACNVYGGVELDFVAEGVAVQGEPVRMRVWGPCRANEKDNTRMQVLWLPVQRAFDQRPQDLASLSINAAERGVLVAAGFQVPALSPAVQRLMASSGGASSGGSRATGEKSKATSAAGGGSTEDAATDGALNRATSSGARVLDAPATGEASVAADDEDEVSGFIVKRDGGDVGAGRGQLATRGGDAYLRATVSFENIGDAWPKNWVLSGVKLLKTMPLEADKQGQDEDKNKDGALAGAVQRDTASVGPADISVDFGEARRILGGRNVELKFE